MIQWHQATLRLDSYMYCERPLRFDRSESSDPGWVMMALESGSFKYQIGLECGIAKRGDIVLCPPGEIFNRELIDPLRLHYVRFRFLDGELVPLSLYLPACKSSPTDSRRLYSDYAYWRKLRYIRDTASTMRMQWMLNDIWQLICDGWNGPVSAEGLPQVLDAEDPLMVQAVQWLREKAFSPFSMRELSDKLEMSPYQLTGRFRQSFHMTPSEFVRTLRIRKAAELLVETELTLEQIARSCGYDNGFYLSRIFTKTMNMRPSVYRERHRV